MKTEVNIKKEELKKKLNVLLCDYQIYYQNLRAFHWLVKGPQFYQLHEKFEDFYNRAAGDIDEVAERILMIGGKPLHTFEDYLQHASLKAERDLEQPSEMLPVVIANNESMLRSFRSLLALAAETEDEGTVALMSEFVSYTEKQLWMLKSLQS